MVPTRPYMWKWLVMAAQDPETGEENFFIDKCLPFGASISCSHFQRFSNVLTHLFEFYTGQKDCVTNYLDDFRFVETEPELCNQLVRNFIKLCNILGVPKADEKTEWSFDKMIFLGIVINGRNRILCIQEEKRIQAVNMLNYIISKCKATVKELQCLSRYLNFLTRAVFPCRTFTRQMYAKFTSTVKSNKLKAYHHVTLDQEFKND